MILIGKCKYKPLDNLECYYSYPLSTKESNLNKCFKKITELWLFYGKQKHQSFFAKFVGIKTGKEITENYAEQRQEIIHDKNYALFKITQRCSPRSNKKIFLLRLSDFSSSLDIQRKLKQCFEKCEYKSKEIDKYLPQILTQYPTNQFRVCEKTLSYELFSWDQLVSIEKPNANKFTAIELFAGAGGLSIGLEKAGISVVLANEIMPDFAATLKANHPNTNVINADIHEINFREELKKIGLDSVDVLSGGPPCQGFSTIGAKNKQDPRNSLFYEYLRVVQETNPKYTIFENVSGFKRMYGGFAYETLVKEMEILGYETKCQILNAADFGTPQIRYRTIVLGWKKGLKPLSFPVATHGKKRGLIPYVTLMEAISDLPPIESGQSSTRYETLPQTEYQQKMRGKQKILLEHNASNYGEKMQQILHIIPEGGTIKDLPENLRPKSAYCNTYARLYPNEPSPTITRNFGTPSSSRCIHPYQPRALSTREGARLQGFPDSYKFVGGKQSKNLQIGNAVPPILGEAVALVIKNALEFGERYNEKKDFVPKRSKSKKS